jgi:hypothetical protein
MEFSLVYEEEEEFMQHNNMGSDFHFSLKLDLEKVLASP